MQRRLFIVIGIVLAILAVLGILFVVFLSPDGGIGQVVQQPTPIPPGVTDAPIQTVPVIVARQPIGRGGEFPGGSLGRQEFPVDNVPPNAITNEAETIGKIAKIEIAQGQIILRDYLQDRALGAASEAAFQVPNGRVMVAFPIDRLSSVGYALQEGDFVDVLITASFVDFDPEFQTILPNKFAFIDRTEDPDSGIVSLTVGAEIQRGRFVIENEEFPALEWPSEEQRPRRVAQLTVQAAKVIKVGPWIEEATPQQQPTQEGTEPPPPPPPDIISIAVTPQDALVMLWARQTQARMELALRAAGDENAIHSTEAVTLQYMLTRFNIAVPPKLEFGIEKSDEPFLLTPVVAPAVNEEVAP